MPITTAALILGLTAGARDYDTEALGFTSEDGTYGTTHTQHIVQIFNSSNTSLQTAPTTTASRFTVPAVVNATTVKSYLDAAVVCSVTTTSTCAKIAFALVNSSSTANAIDAINTTTWAGGTSNGATTARTYTTAGRNSDGDVFMIITLETPISVTSGGYLTVKGGGDTLTYITLQST